MLDILNIVAPVFLIIGAGYASVKIGFFKTEYADVMMKYVMTIAIPMFLFNAVAKLDLGATFDLPLLGSFYIGAAIAFLSGKLVAQYIFNRPPGEAVAVGFSALFANLVLLGLPIAELAYGREALSYGVAIVSVHAPFCYLTGILFMEFARADGRKLSETIVIAGKTMFSNALTIGIALGFLVNLTRIPLPEAIYTSTELMGRAGPPTALFALGAILTRYSISDRIGEIGFLSLLRLIIVPLIVYGLAFHVFNLPEIAAKTAVIMAAMPSGLNTYVFADMYNRAKGTAASNVLVATSFAVISVSVWLAILG